MKHFKTWTYRLIATTVLIATLLLIIVVNPAITYANKTERNHYNIYRNQALPSSFMQSLDSATTLLQTSELYNNHYKLDICLNDGAIYPQLIETLCGQAFARGFYNKVVVNGNVNYQNSTVVLNGYNWQLTQLLTHEIIHCLQFKKLGFWHSNPIVNIPNWKWEGYAEYIARQKTEQKNLADNITLLQHSDAKKWAIHLSDSTIAPREYFHYLTLVQYCLKVRKMTFNQLLVDTTSEQTVNANMMTWYNSSINK